MALLGRLYINITPKTHKGWSFTLVAGQGLGISNTEIKIDKNQTTR
jgi:hypothetical protein